MISQQSTPVNEQTNRNSAAVARDTPGESGPGERVSTILADRVCTGCLFNLAGQPVYRERHYRMLIAVCPECGTAASVQEYPHLGKWSRRAVMLFAALWLCTLLAALVGSGGVLFMSGHGLTTTLSEPLAMKIAEAHAEHHRKQLEIPGPPTQNAAWYAQQPVTLYSPIDPLFLANADMDAIRASANIVGFLTEFRLLFRASLAGLAAMGVGVLWSVLLPHARFARRLLLVLPIALTSALFLWLMYKNHVANIGVSWGWQHAQMIAMKDIYWPWAFVVAAVLLPMTVIGLAVGRPIGRAAVRLLLPPRLREPLYFLWFCDGLCPPVESRK